MKHAESKLQIACVTWFRLQYPNEVLFAIPNGGQRNAITAKILKAEGTLAGVADLFLAKTEIQKLDGVGSGYNIRYFGLFIEMKTDKGRQAPSQIEFQKAVEGKGYKYIICRSFDEFKAEIDNYLKH